MTNNAIPVTVRILEKEYKIACPAGEHQSLLESAELLNNKMNEIKKGGKILGAERIAVIAAINLAHELLIEQKKGQDQESISTRLDAIQSSVESALHSANS